MILEVTEAKDDEVLCKARRGEGDAVTLAHLKSDGSHEVVNNCKLGEKKNVNVPGTSRPNQPPKKNTGNPALSRCEGGHPGCG